MRLAGFLLSTAVVAGAACLPLTSDRILARDLAAADPTFESTTPDQVISFAPLPGAQRTFSTRELERVAKRLGLNTPISNPLCFERSVAHIAPEQMQTAMAAAINLRFEDIEIFDYSRYAVPSGQVEFLRTGLGTPSPASPEAPVLWRGRVVYDKERSIPIWASVRIHAETSVVTAREHIERGQIIQPSQVTTALKKQFPFSPAAKVTLDQVIGQIARRPVMAGEMLQPNLLEQPREVGQGDVVQVSAISGSAQLIFEAHAQSGGRKGDSILVQNPSNGRSFRAKVVDKGKVEVLASQN